MAQVRMMLMHRQHLSNLFGRPVTEMECAIDWTTHHYAIWFRKQHPCG